MAFCLVELRQTGTDDAQIVHPAMAIKASVLDGQHGVLHDLGDLRDRHEAPPLLAELGQQHIVRRQHSQWEPGSVVRQPADGRQVGVGDGQRQSQHQQQNHQGGDHAATQPGQRTQDAVDSRAALATLWPTLSHKRRSGLGILFVSHMGECIERPGGLFAGPAIAPREALARFQNVCQAQRGGGV